MHKFYFLPAVCAALALIEIYSAGEKQDLRKAVQTSSV